MGMFLFFFLCCLMGSPYQCSEDLRQENTRINLIQHLQACAGHVTARNLLYADALLEKISQLASPDGDSVQRLATFVSEALACRVIAEQFPGSYKAITSNNPSKTTSISEELDVKKLFFKMCPFFQLAYLITNQAIVDAMEEEKVVHIIDLSASEPDQWTDLLLTFNARREGPPYLKITVVHEKKEVLDQMGFHLIREAEKLNFPLQFNPIVSTLEDLDFEKLTIKSGEALAISCVLRLHSLLAADDEMASTSNSPAAARNLQRFGSTPMNSCIFSEFYGKDRRMNPYISSPNSALSPLSLGASPKMGSFLNNLWKLQPKLMVITEQESELNSSNLKERVDEVLNFYGAMFDCLDSTVSKTSLERKKLERALLGEEIKNIIACEGVARKERHEKLNKWILWLELAGFRSVPFSYHGRMQAHWLLQRFGHCYRIREDKQGLIICWNAVSLFSVSAWRLR